MKKYVTAIFTAILILSVFTLLKTEPAYAYSILAEKLSGYLLLRTEAKGEAWYVNPKNLKRYYLGRPADAFEVMKKLSTGISDADLKKIVPDYADTTPEITPVQPPSNEETFYTAASAIRQGNDSAAISYFTDEMQPVMAHALTSLNNEGKFNLGNIMSGAKLSSSTADEKIYSTTIYFAGYTKTLYFHVKKQASGKWLIANL